MSEYVEVHTTKASTRYVGPEVINPDGAAAKEVPGWAILIAAACTIALIGLSLATLLSAF
ncbi:MAG: hypothetical protein DI537_14415 [Stutzerimonas stutzeri]|nr:MAG: hypothetical protein DI537_14415 [Stutzerimonas stutzeri]